MAEQADAVLCGIPTSTVERLPVELWEEIILQSLTHDVMFLAAPFTRDLVRNSLLSEWQLATHFRAQRNILRLVCRSWKNFVDFACSPHIHVEMERFGDFGTRFHECAKHADRIDGLSIRRMLSEQIDRKPSQLSADVSRPLAAYFQFRAFPAAAEKGIQYPARILANLEREVLDDILKYKALFPRLEALHVDLERDQRRHPLERLLSRVTTNYPALISFHVRLGFSSLYVLDEERFELAHLRSVSITHNSVILTPLKHELWSLPSLTYLELGPLRDLEQLLGSLPTLGRKLQTLRVTSAVSLWFRRHQLPWANLWTSCPELRNLGFPMVPLLEHPPPPTHPLRYLINLRRLENVFDEMASFLSSGELIERVLRFCDRAQHIVAVGDSHSWADVLEGPDGKGPRTLLVGISDALQVRGVRYEDRFGKTMREAMV